MPGWSRSMPASPRPARPDSARRASARRRREVRRGELREAVDAERLLDRDRPADHVREGCVTELVALQLGELLAEAGYTTVSSRASCGFELSSAAPRSAAPPVMPLYYSS